MISMPLGVNTKLFFNSCCFGRLRCYMSWSREMSLVNYAEARYGRIRKRNRRQKAYCKAIEVTQHSNLHRRSPVNKTKNYNLDKLLYSEKSFSILSHRMGMEDAYTISEAEPSISSETAWDSAHEKLVGPVALRELPEDVTEDIKALSQNLEPIHSHEAEGDAVEIVTESDYETIKSKMKNEIERSYPCSKKKQVYKKGVLEKVRKVDATSKRHQKDCSHEMKFSKSELATRKESFVQSILSYVDACISCGFLNHAMKTLMLYRERSKQSDINGCFYSGDVRVYEILLHGYAAKKNIFKVEELMRVMTEDGIAQTAQCYAACFECVARRVDGCGSNMKVGLHVPGSTDASAKKKLKTWVSEMMQKDLTLNDLIAKTCLLSDQKNMVITSIMKVDPHFKPVFPPCPKFDYACGLLQDIKEYDHLGYQSPVSGLVDGEQLKMLSLEQLQSELMGCVEVKSIEHRQEPNELIIFQREKLAESKEEWRKAILNALCQELQTLRQCFQVGARAHRFMNIYPFLASVNKEELVELVLQEIHKLAEGSETFSPTTNQLYRELGSRVLERYQVSWKKRTGILHKVKHLHGKYCEWYSNPDGVTLSEKQITCTRQAWQSLVHSHQDEGASLNFREKSWPTTILLGIGKFLYDIILHEIMIDINILRPRNKKSHRLPAFYTLFRTQQHGKMVKEEVKPHPVLVRLFRGAASDTIKFPTIYMPMLCPPMPWTTAVSGAYIVAKADVIRLPQQGMLQWNRLLNCHTQQLYPGLDSLNQLGAVPWKVNKKVLEIVIEVFNSGGSSHLSIPVPPSSFSSTLIPPVVSPPKPESSLDQDKNPNAILQAERFRLQRYHLYLRRKKAEAYSLWCDMLYRLSVANHLRDRIFWFPHNMDFRGRVYPCPPHLNHLGSDVARSFLCFAKGQPLGPRGLDWLKLHLINLTGSMKHNSTKERMAFSEEIMPEIIDSAEKPLTGNMWWAKSDEPWQTLAVCMEINAALKAEGGQENYVCHFPVHQDGSCNGLQHYAALGRDAIGAASVSMTPSECPQDVYSTVVAMVERERESDARLGISIAQILEGFVCRKVIKQTVMTTVYGVTRFGARLQIARQLRDIDEFPKEHVWSASSYLVGKTFGCLREMFTSTKEIQDWFTDCARFISQVCGKSVEWVTPLGLPVVQPYQRLIGSKQHGIADPLSLGFVKAPFGERERPNVMKQKNAFPPNFIHSIDSCHMMLTSLWCERRGLTFVSVHDCYWTHPSTVEVMNKICREQFVSLHSQPILEDLSAFFIQNYSYLEEDFDDNRILDMSKRKLNAVLTQVPKKGDFDLKSVLDSVYFFS